MLRTPLSRTLMVLEDRFLDRCPRGHCRGGHHVEFLGVLVSLLSSSLLWCRWCHRTDIQGDQPNRLLDCRKIGLRTSPVCGCLRGGDRQSCSSCNKFHHKFWYSIVSAHQFLEYMTIFKLVLTKKQVDRWNIVHLPSFHRTRKCPERILISIGPHLPCPWATQKIITTWHLNTTTF